MAPEADAHRMRQELVARLKGLGYLDNPQLEQAFATIPRHHFVPGQPVKTAYADEALPVQYDSAGNLTSSASQPAMMAWMLHHLQLQPGHHVLEIGTGTGYNAALMRHLVGPAGKVTTIELDPQLAGQAAAALHRAGMPDVQVITADGAAGYARNAPYDRIIATAGLWDVPTAWVQQLQPDGILIAPLWLTAGQICAVLHKQTNTLYSEHNLPCGFIGLRGKQRGTPDVMTLPNAGLTLATSAIHHTQPTRLEALIQAGGYPASLQYPMRPGIYAHFLLWLTVNTPQQLALVSYTSVGEQRMMEMQHSGFGLVGASSACFVPWQSGADVVCFGTSAASDALNGALRQWYAAGRPTADALRLRLRPHDAPVPADGTGFLSERQEHNLYLWLATK